MAMDHLTEIRRFLRERSNDRVKVNLRKYIPTSEKVYGVCISEINKIVPKYKSGGFKLVEKLWDDECLEERILAAKILGKICNQNPELTLKLITKFANDIRDWAVCDTLATQGIRAIANIKQKEILELSRELIKSENPLKKRFGIVLLINFVGDKNLRSEIKEIIRSVENNREHYVRKALNWIKRRIG